MIQPLNILVIDDDETFRRVLTLALRGLGHNVTEAGHGREGMRRLSEGRFDLVLVDLFMPEMEGLETIGEIQKRCPEQRIIAMSGSRDHLGQNAALRAAGHLGANAMLEKPFSREGLQLALTSALGKTSQKRYIRRCEFDGLSASSPIFMPTVAGGIAS